MKIFLLLIVAAFIEYLGVLVFLKNIIVESVVLHTLASCMFVLALQTYLQNQTSRKNSDIIFSLFIFLLCQVIPILGAIISFYIILTFKQTRLKIAPRPEVLNADIRLHEIEPFSLKFGEGSVFLQLFNSAEKITKRTSAFAALKGMDLAKVNQLMYKLLPEKQDEIRLLAFNILENQENTISERIHNLLESKVQSKNPGVLAKDLAMQYWELIYNHLISEELKNIILNKATEYALIAVKHLPKDASLWILIGKIYKYSKQYYLAEKAFTRAISLKAPPAHTLPYLAEIKYINKDFHGVKDYLSRSESLLDLPNIAPVKQFWDEK